MTATSFTPSSPAATATAPPPPPPMFGVVAPTAPPASTGGGSGTSPLPAFPTLDPALGGAQGSSGTAIQTLVSPTEGEGGQASQEKPGSPKAEGEDIPTGRLPSFRAVGKGRRTKLWSFDIKKFYRDQIDNAWTTEAADAVERMLIGMIEKFCETANQLSATDKQGKTGKKKRLTFKLTRSIFSMILPRKLFKEYTLDDEKRVEGEIVGRTVTSGKKGKKEDEGEKKGSDDDEKKEINRVKIVAKIPKVKRYFNEVYGISITTSGLNHVAIVISGIIDEFVEMLAEWVKGTNSRISLNTVGEVLAEPEYGDFTGVFRDFIGPKTANIVRAVMANNRLELAKEIAAAKAASKSEQRPPKKKKKSSQ